MVDSIPTKALTLWAPWAWALMYAGKDVENRSLCFPRYVRGRVWIHAGMWPCAGQLPGSGPVRRRWEESLLDVVEMMLVPPHHNVPSAASLRGHIVGSIDVYGYRDPADQPNSRWYVPGSRAIMVREPRPLVSPVPAKGSQGWWNIDDETRALLEVAQ